VGVDEFAAVTCVSSGFNLRLSDVGVHQTFRPFNFFLFRQVARVQTEKCCARRLKRPTDRVSQAMCQSLITHLKLRDLSQIATKIVAYWKETMANVAGVLRYFTVFSAFFGEPN
jgi:hypothetical protein